MGSAVTSGAASTRHLHLDPVGGMAGDMFVSAMLDAFPAIVQQCWKDLEDADLLQKVAVNAVPGHSHGLAVQRLLVEHTTSTPERTGRYKELKQWLEDCSLNDAVRQGALSLLKLLAEAESQVHGVDIEQVHFHEVADWDSLVDVVAAASVIEHSGVDSWSCGPLPLGSGLVKTQHGQLPVPAPATAVLLQDLCVWDDGVGGERVTPTGAAIVRYLLIQNDGSVEHRVQRPMGTVRAVGCGAGHRNLADRPNIVRCVLIETPAAAVLSTALDAEKQTTDQVVQIVFDIDDMTAEEIAVSMDHIRATDGVLDVRYQLGSGKKGRSVVIVNVLCQPECEESVSAVCFTETTTLGMRVQTVTRRVLQRSLHGVSDELGSATIKTARRGSVTTAKVESDDLGSIRGLQARRQRAQNLQKAFDS